MTEKSPRRQRLEASLAEDPADPFLRYGLAMQCLREGDVAEGRERLLGLVADDPGGQIPAYQQLGQSYVDTDEAESARAILKTGITQARASGDFHAASEMDGLLGML